VSRGAVKLELVRRGEPSASVERRLWPGLSRLFERPLPARGMDVLGERVSGVLRRLKLRRLDAERAERILSGAAALREIGERALGERITAARERVVLDRNHPGAIDAAYAVGVEAIRRELSLTLHPVQVLAGLAMAEGCCAELATGEGKTVSAILPGAIDAWGGRGVHVITVNDYLARRDAETCGPVYRRLGISVGVIQEGMKPAERREAYSRSITYAADKQVIFDHLRDRLHSPLDPSLARVLLDGLFGADPAEDHRADWTDHVVQRGLHAAIVDEADSVLIDEAVTPAIIGADAAGSGESGGAHYLTGAVIASGMVGGEHYHLDHRMRHVRLTDAGRALIAEHAAELPAFWAGPRRREELLVQALQAKELFVRGDDYVIKDGKVVIVDRSTGRILPGRQWQLGVHQAVEAKEGLAISHDRTTSSRVSYEQFFQRYRRLSGMTGTAMEVAGELWKSYRLPVVRIPTHRPVARVHAPDRYFALEREKFEAVAARVQELHRARRPVLVGTRSVIASERLGETLAARGISCQILNATREAEEAVIVRHAGEPGAVTVATNMAGRGTDIALGAGVRESGGLVVIATERHEESRVDRQLFGRSGRQGDPGLAEAFVSLEDGLIVLHGPKFLVALVRRASGARRELLCRVLWRAAQWSSGRKARVMRSQVLMSDAMTDMALHHRTR